eukprot:6471665-Karenia_brevis.AAC.1
MDNFPHLDYLDGRPSHLDYLDGRPSLPALPGWRSFPTWITWDRQTSLPGLLSLPGRPGWRTFTHLDVII